MNNYTCPRCGSHNKNWARTLASGRQVCGYCYLELPFSRCNSNLVEDDMRTDVPTKRKIVVRW